MSAFPKRRLGLGLRMNFSWKRRSRYVFLEIKISTNYVCKINKNSPHLQLLLLLPRYLGLYLFSFVWFFPYSFRCVYRSFLEICIFCTYHRLELLALGVYPRPQPKRKNGILLLKFSKSAMIKIFPKLHSAFITCFKGSLRIKIVSQKSYPIYFSTKF